MITINDLHKSFGRNQVLKGVDLVIPQGTITAVLGPNGSGKTTILKALLGLVIPDSGQLQWKQKTLRGDSQYRNRIGYLPQIARFPENLKVRELFAMIRDIRQQPSFEEPLIETFKLESFLNERLQYLSGGTRQKVNTVLTFMFDNDLFILDEPTAGLDPVAMIKLKELIVKKKQEGKTILLTTHIMSLVEELAERIIFLLEGKIHFQGSIQELKDRHQERNLERAIASILEDSRNSRNINSPLSMVTSS